MHNLQHAVLESFKHRLVALNLLRHLLFENWLNHIHQVLSFGFTLLFLVVRDVLAFLLRTLHSGKFSVITAYVFFVHGARSLSNVR